MEKKLKEGGERERERERKKKQEGVEHRQSLASKRFLIKTFLLSFFFLVDSGLDRSLSFPGEMFFVTLVYAAIALAISAVVSGCREGWKIHAASTKSI